MNLSPESFVLQSGKMCLENHGFTYIAFEGIDGSGKSTQVARLSTYLSSHGITAQQYHFTYKGASLTGRLVKGLYVNEPPRWAVPLRRFEILQAILYALNARHNLNGIMRKQSGFDILIGDRSIVTAFATHPILFTSFWGRLLWMLEPKLIPDHVLLLDLDPATGLSRIRERNDHGVDELLERQLQMRNEYLCLMRGKHTAVFGQTRWHVIDASQPVDHVFKQVQNVVVGVIGIPLGSQNSYCNKRNFQGGDYDQP